MSPASILWLFITAGGAALLAFGLAIGLLTTRRRRDSSVAQRLADAATREQYRAEEKSRPDRDAADPPEARSSSLGPAGRTRSQRKHSPHRLPCCDRRCRLRALYVGRALSNIGGQAFPAEGSRAAREIGHPHDQEYSRAEDKGNAAPLKELAYLPSIFPPKRRSSSSAPKGTSGHQGQSSSVFRCPARQRDLGVSVCSGKVCAIA